MEAYKEVFKQVVKEFQLNESELPSLEDTISLFVGLDANKDGKVTKEEASDSGVPEVVVNKLFGEDGDDLDGDGAIDKQELLCAYFKPYVTNQLIDTFKDFDKDRNDTLESGELEAFLASINVHGEAAVEEFMEEHDEDGDGNISLNEFYEYSNKKLINFVKEIMLVQ